MGDGGVALGRRPTALRRVPERLEGTREQHRLRVPVPGRAEEVRGDLEHLSGHRGRQSGPTGTGIFIIF